MQDTPLATVIIPSYNSPDLYAALASVLAQDYPRIQLIVVDDGSASFSRREVENYLQEHGTLETFTVLVNNENLGTVRTLNRALLCSRGEFLFNLAGDDCFYDDHVLSDWISAFRATGAEVMTAYRGIFDEDLRVQTGRLPTAEQADKIRTLSPAELFEDLAQVNYIFGCCTARTAESLRRYGLFDEGYRLIEDHPMNLKLLRQGVPIIFFDRTVVKYRSGGTSSPLRYNEAYARDVDRVLAHDVLPYTKNQRKMRRKYNQWKRDQKLLRRRAQLLARHGNSRFRAALITLWYGLHHPLRALCKLVALAKSPKEGDS